MKRRIIVIDSLGLAIPLGGCIIYSKRMLNNSLNNIIRRVI
jgi:hypothetical protein